MTINKSLIEKPIDWENKTLVFQENNLQIDKTNTASVYNLNIKLGEILNTKNSELTRHLNCLESRQLKILYFNLSKFEEQQTHYLIKLIKSYLPSMITRSVFSTSPIQTLIDKIKTILTEKEKWTPSSPYPKLSPLNLKERASFLSSEINVTKKTYEKYFNILNTMREDYLVLNHALDTKVTIFHDIYKELYKLKFPNIDLKNFKVLRDPLHELHKQDVTGLTEHSIISLDVVTNHVDPAESAYYFYKSKRSNTPNVHEDIRENLFKNYHLNVEQEKVLIKKINDIMELINTHPSNMGSLLAICLPKEIAFKSEKPPFYLSGPHGIRIAIKTDKHSIEDVVKSLQYGNEQQLKSNGTLPNEIIQGRVSVSKITPENKFKIFKINSIPKEIKSQYKQSVKLIAQELYKNYELYRAQEGFVNLDSARQSTIDPNESHHCRIGKGDEEDRLGKAKASPNSPNLTERGISRIKSVES